MLWTGFITLGFIKEEKQQNKKGIKGFRSDWQRQKWKMAFTQDKMIDWQFNTLLHTNPDAALKPPLHSITPSFSLLFFLLQTLIHLVPSWLILTSQSEEASRWGFMLHASVHCERVKGEHRVQMFPTDPVLLGSPIYIYIYIYIYIHRERERVKVKQAQ